MEKLLELPNEVQKKLKGLISLAARQAKVVYGTDNLLQAKHIEIVFMSDSLSENARKKLNARFAEIFVSGSIEPLTGKENCKIFGVASGTLAAEIRRNVNLSFTNAETGAGE
ncbi:MAG: hypothetical protein LBN25_03960 [Christensenellaceae bacterium]|jgi:hypothetical protein|nr:hypothetical protein [Christensenellaceae bacterium]